MKPQYSIKEYDYSSSEADKPKVHVEIENLASLPFVLRRLHELGYDLSEAYNVLEACEEERKRNVLSVAMDIMKQPPAEKSETP